jgi:hypothetical protein
VDIDKATEEREFDAQQRQMLSEAAAQQPIAGPLRTHTSDNVHTVNHAPTPRATSQNYGGE